MEKRICTKCNKEKELSEYYFRTDYQRYSTVCKKCCIKRSKKYRDSHIDYYKKYMKDYRKTHKGYYKNYMSENRNKYKELQRDWYENNKDERQEYQKNYYKNNKEHVCNYNRNYRKKLKETSDVYREKVKLSQKLRKVFTSKGKYDSKILEKITKIKNTDLYVYLLETFKNNYGYEYCGEEVHIDHKTPLAKANTIEDVHRLNHYTNLQLLYPEDNMKKWKY